jgi:transposase
VGASQLHPSRPIRWPPRPYTPSVGGISTTSADATADRLDGWLAAAKGSALAGFADALARDLDAVRAALTLPWSTGPVEGQISRLKTLKRAMCGRAGFELLRRRVLLAA